MTIAERVKHHWQCYMNGKPEISDAEFDALVLQLQLTDPANPMLDYIGRAGGSVKHAVPMLSLQKVYSVDDLMKWAGTVPDYGFKMPYNKPESVGEFVVMPKYDGMALSLLYENGVLIRAATRGDGQAGEDVTKHAYCIPSIPKSISAKHALEVRGEVLLRKDKLAVVGGANCRNVTAGIMGSKEPQRAKDLSFVAYDSSEDNIAVATLMWRLVSLRDDFGFEVGTAWAGTRDQLAAVVQTVTSDVYDLDGVVIVANQNWNRDKLGATNHHPRWAVALKSAGEIAQSIVRRIEWSVGRTGVVTPVAIIDPVALAGVTIERVTVHNVATLKEMCVAVGNEVSISRRGGVIPHIEAVTNAVRDHYSIPATCADCGDKLVEVGRVLQHTTAHGLDGCALVARAKVDFWLKTIGVNGFGDSTLQKYEITSVVGLYESWQLPPHLMNPLWDKKVVPLAKALEGLGVVSAEKLATKFRSWPNIAKASIAELIEIDGIGKTTAEAIQLQMVEAVETLYKLGERGVVIENELPPALDTMKGLSFVFTGELSSMSRTTAQKLVRDRGGDTPTTVTKKTTHLVAVKESTSSKYQKAKTLGVEIITEDEFKAMLGEIKVSIVGAVDLIKQAHQK